jgi:tetratricopeptide (TPR) repeat protein
LAALHNNPTLDKADWKFAHEVVQSHPQQEDPQSLIRAAWDLLRDRNAGKDAYVLALRQAEAAVRLVPKDSSFLFALGVAQYRVGRYADALATLTKSEKLNATKEGSNPLDLAFLAMTQHQLGKKDEAKATLDRLRKTMKQLSLSWPAKEIAEDILREAKELIEGKVGGKKE